MSSRGPLIIIGASARAAAQSAIRAGYEPWCIDLFADRDLQAIAPVKRCPRERWPQGIPELLTDAPPGPVLFSGAMENHPEILREIERTRRLLTGSAAAIEQVRRPRAFHQAMMHALDAWSREQGWRESIADQPAVHWEDDLAASDPHDWHRRARSAFERGVEHLIKPRSGGGGRGIRPWHPDHPISADEQVQQRIIGRSLSAVVWSQEGQAQVLGISEQLIGDAAFGAGPFGYTGSVTVNLPEAVRWQFRSAANALVMWSGLQGLFGIDAILSVERDESMPLNAGRLHVVDINPRYPASAELFERRDRRRSVLHVDDAAAAVAEGRFIGKAIVHAKRRCRWPVHDATAAADWIADVPEAGEMFEVGWPVCTVFADGITREMCLAGLRERAQAIYTRLSPA